MSHIFLFSLYLFFAHISPGFGFPWSWAKDPFMEGMLTDGCDFPIIDMSKPEATVDTSLSFPYIARYVDLEWPAFRKWEKEAFLAQYGSNYVRSGSEASIVHSGGVAENETTLSGMINSMSHQNSQSFGDSFLFDTTILKSIPELTEDFDVPSIFRNWDTPENESTGALWHMMSLGPSRSGLPFHGHGKTWLTVVHGIKQWFVYPPGFDPPPSIDQSFNPMFPVSKWVNEVYPRLASFPKPPRTFFPTNDEISNLDHSAAPNDTLESGPEHGFQPFECRQMPGDVMFLPRRWSHMTFNIGETIAIGGQETLYNEDRLVDANNVLETRPNNYDAWRDKGLALFNLAAVERNALRRSINTHQHNKLIVLEGTPRRLDDFLSRTHDTWVVLYYDSAKTPNIIDGRSDWSRLENSLHGVANVAIFDLAGQYTEISSDVIAREADYEVVYADPTYIATAMQTHRTVYEVDALHRYASLPMVKVHLGNARTPTAGFSFVPDISGQPWEGDVHNGSAIEAAVRTEMAKRNKSTGSIATVSVALQHRFLEALVYMRHALTIKPMQPELQCMAAEVAGLAGDLTSMHEIVRKAVRILDAVDRKEMAPISLASTYHKISSVYIKVHMWNDALPIMLKAVQVLPAFLPALSDIVYIHTMLGDRNAAEYALEVLKVTAKDTPKKASDVKQHTEQIEGVPWK